MAEQGLTIGVGELRFNVRYSNVRTGDRGPSLRIYGDVEGKPVQLLRFDCFEDQPHFHYDPEGKNNQLVWHCEAVDYKWLLNRRRPFGSYSQVSASTIVKDLIARYAPVFTTNFVQTDLAKVSFFADGTASLLQQLQSLWLPHPARAKKR
jgi:hypothetical protein